MGDGGYGSGSKGSPYGGGPPAYPQGGGTYDRMSSNGMWNGMQTHNYNDPNGSKGAPSQGMQNYSHGGTSMSPFAGGYNPGAQNQNWTQPLSGPMQNTGGFAGGGRPAPGGLPAPAPQTQAPFNAQSAQALYNQYQGLNGGAGADSLIQQMQGNDNGAGFNAAMRQGGNMLNGNANTGQFSYQGGHQGTPSPMNPYGNTNPYTPGGVTDQVNAMVHAPNRYAATNATRGMSGGNPMLNNGPGRVANYGAHYNSSSASGHRG